MNKNKESAEQQSPQQENRKRTSCYLCKLSQDYFVLLTGRVLGGFSSSLLFSSFESWYSHEHTEHHDFPAEWLPHTFSQVATWNGAIAIVAGVTANACAEWLGLGPASPSVLAVPLLGLSVALMFREWDENRGQSSSITRSCGDGLRCLLRDRRVLLLGAIQALFESVVYIFIFLWTPVLDPYNTPLGIAFSGFMAASATGSSLYRLATSKKYHLQPMHILCLSVLMVFFSLFMLTFSTAPGQERPTESFLAFLLIELASGLYFPAMSFLRRRLIPEKDQTGVMNWFRVPLNLIAGLGLLVLHDSDYQSGTRNMFSLCAVTMLLALLSVVGLFSMVNRTVDYLRNYRVSFAYFVRIPPAVLRLADSYRGAGHTCEVKTISGDYLLKLIKRMPRVCKAVMKAKGGYFEEPRINSKRGKCLYGASYGAIKFVQQCMGQGDKEPAQWGKSKASSCKCAICAKKTTLAKEARNFDSQEGKSMPEELLDEGKLSPSPVALKYGKYYLSSDNMEEVRRLMEVEEKKTTRTIKEEMFGGL
ncbi:unnamed protein product [Ranitomeya imitator]|uniref:Molybdate-anion transporter n=1 Tax=Ranitomeya imitator TaxID=111125 RepID=A0ABN9L1V3_9NEOB|nr:unnamed protein product [Ranitomeya imitator]